MSFESVTPKNTPLVQPLPPQSPSHLHCTSCFEGKDLVYGANPDDGIVVCADCGAPLFYCDLGGQG